MASSHIYRHLVVQNENFRYLLTYSDQQWQFYIATDIKGNVSVTQGKSYDIPPLFETARAQSELFAIQCGQWEPIRNSQLIGRYKEMSVNLMIYPPPQFETARAQSELFAFQCSQWKPIRNSQLIGKYKEMSVWHQVNLTIYPPTIYLTEHRVISSLFNVVIDTQRQIYPPKSFEQHISLIARSTTMHIYI